MKAFVHVHCRMRPEHCDCPTSERRPMRLKLVPSSEVVQPRVERAA